MSKDAYEFIEELGQRFPDISDQDVIEAYIDYTCYPGYLNVDSRIGRTILLVYEYGIDRAAPKAKSLYNIDISLES